jgi:hypothetical protein
MDPETLYIRTHLVVAWAINLGTEQNLGALDPRVVAGVTPICATRQSVAPPYAFPRKHESFKDPVIETDKGEVFESVTAWREAVKGKRA